ncbi:MAG: glycosyltransferase family 4 protein [Candidatus Sericytochromatia bacterium]|nr:glycosyltransferase family 4 protein [Candidatus Sericytochromatia bacterium]
MRILMLSWEYPPRIVGGIARHVEEISEALVLQGHEVHVVTADHPGTAERETVNGVHLHRVKNFPFDPPDFLSWVMQLQLGMVAYALEAHAVAPFDLVHAHDWLTAHAGITLKKGLGIPLVATIHATEVGRNRGHLVSDFSKFVNQMEWRLCFEAWRVIVCSSFMLNEVRGAFGLPDDKLDVIPNGVKYEKFAPSMTATERLQFRRHFAADHQKLVFFVGRMTPEKGAQVLLEAVPKVLAEYGEARFVIVGKGGFLADLKRRANELGVAPYVNFTGFVSDADLLKLYQVIDVAVFPSLYEPFGIVALEGMAARVPVVVSDTGGLGSIVEHTKSGITTFAGNQDSLGWGILEVLKNQEYAGMLAANGRKRVEQVFNWPAIAKSTGAVYGRVLKESGGAQAAPRTDKAEKTLEVGAVVSQARH